MHVFFRFHHHSSIPGRFAIDVSLAKDDHSPRHWGFADAPTVPGALGEGPHRIGRFVGARRGDKWWILRRDDFAIGRSLSNEDYWYPTDYEDQSLMINEAIKDVTRDIEVVCQKLGLSSRNQ